MNRLVSILIASGAAAMMLAPAGDSFSQVQTRQREQARERTQEKARRHEIIPGSELMTPAEREAYRKRYASAKTDEEREAVRARHVGSMQERARMRGLQLAEPGAAGTGSGK